MVLFSLRKATSPRVFNTGSNAAPATQIIYFYAVVALLPALLVGMLYRDDETSEWAFEAIAEAAHGRMAQDNIDELQAFIKRKPRTKLAPPRPPPGPGNAMLMWREKQHGVARALGGAAQFVRTASGRLLGAGQQPTVAVAIPIAHGTEVKLS